MGQEVCVEGVSLTVATSLSGLLAIWWERKAICEKSFAEAQTHFVSSENTIRYYRYPDTIRYP